MKVRVTYKAPQMSVDEVFSGDTADAVVKAMQKAVARQRADAEKADTESLEDLKKRGMQFDAPSAQLIADMRKSTSGVLDLLKQKVDPKLVDEVLAESK